MNPILKLLYSIFS